MGQNAFSEGQQVLVLTLMKTGTILECLGYERYRIGLGSVTICCKASEIKASRASSAQPAKSSVSITSADPKPPSSIDLHGLTVDEASRSLETWLSRVIVAGLPQVKIIHGLGTGKIQNAAHEILGRISAVRAFRINQWNPGETDVFL